MVTEKMLSRMLYAGCVGSTPIQNEDGAFFDWCDVHGMVEHKTIVTDVGVRLCLDCMENPEYHELVRQPETV